MFTKLRSKFKFRKQKEVPSISDGIVLKLPATWEDVTLRQYLGYWSSASDELKVAALTGQDRKTIRKIKQSDLDKIVAFCETIMHPSNEVTTPTPTMRITIDGVDYGYITSLHDTSSGEFADLMNNAQSEKIFQTMPKLFSILYRPVVKVMGSRYAIETYDSDTHLPNADKFLDVKMSVLGGGLSFFTSLLPHLNESSLISLERMTKEMESELMTMKSRAK